MKKKASLRLGQKKCLRRGLGIPLVGATGGPAKPRMVATISGGSITSNGDSVMACLFGRGTAIAFILSTPRPPDVLAWPSSLSSPFLLAPRCHLAASECSLANIYIGQFDSVA